MILLHVLHGDGIITPARVWRAWHAEPLALAGIVATGVLYGAGVRRLRARGARHAVTRARVLSFYAGLAALWIALASPVDALAETLFAAHMLQHVILVAVAAPLVAAAAPIVPSLWGLPYGARRAVGRAWTGGGLAPLGRWLGLPLVVWALHAVALWGWHLPGPYLTALRDPTVHALEHLSFFGTGVLMWWAAFRPFHHPSDRGVGAVLVTLGTFFQSGALGAILTFSSTAWYAPQSVAAGAWGLTALGDQQLAGLIMWIPTGFLYVAVALALVYRWLRDAPAVDASSHVNAPVGDVHTPGLGVVPAAGALH